MVCTNKLSPGYHVVETNLPARPRREYLVIKMNIPMASSLPFWGVDICIYVSAIVKNDDASVL